MRTLLVDALSWTASRWYIDIAQDGSLISEENPV